ncbi:MAG TPA: riboflavin biosynthesis protein RibF [Fibrobacteria bacterium]|nr:riboflavin biosynthesis protein RibF [Fibrobacteria bacterium]
MNAVSWRDVSRPSAPARMTAVALGNFDGAHVGHRRLLEAMRAAALAEGLDPVALTFEPHPRQFLFPDAATSLLTPPREKAERIEALGVEAVTLRFDADLASLPAEDFAREVLLGRLRGARFFLGPGHRFGKGGRGDVGLLRELAGGDDRVVEVPPVIDADEVVSSSAIRHHLKEGRVDRANALLGYRYRLRGDVARGSGRGGPLGFPTANLHPEDARKMLPFGVFGGYAAFEGALHPAVANIGLRPTFGETPPSAEIHILDWKGDLYGKPLEFEIHRFLRGERKFESVEALRRQIAEDVESWRKEAI